MNFLKITYFFPILCIVCKLNISFSQRNVILIIADDLGSNWCAFQENRIDTLNMPNVQKLLSKGVRFSNAWSNPVCSPTRAGILTGRYSFRTGIGNVVTNNVQLDTAEITIPKLMKMSGESIKYSSALIGKWHLNPSIQSRYDYPDRLGWDHYAGLFAGAPTSYTNWTKVINGSARTEMKYLTSDTAEDAIQWLEDQKASPFFLWLAFSAPHSPYHLPPDSLIINKSLSGTTADINTNPKSYFKVMAEAMDNRIGKIYNWLEQNKKLENTDIIFIGDNGNGPRTTQGPTNTRAKSTVYQEGIHVPFIISGSSVVDPGRVSDALVNVQDLFATILEISGLNNWKSIIPSNVHVDSKSLIPIIKNQSTNVREWAYSEVFDLSNASEINARTIRSKTFKLIIFDNPFRQEFYNLSNDPGETKNLLLGSLTANELQEYNNLCFELSKLTNTSSQCNISTSSPQFGNDEIIKVYPNPTTQKIYIKFDDVLKENYKIEIFSFNGNLIYAHSITSISKEFTVNTFDYAKGEYILKISNSFGLMHSTRILLQ
jgi:arylsulfatase B